MLDTDPIAEARRHWVEHGWEHAALGMAAVTSVERAQQILLARIEAVLRPHGLSFARYEVLRLLAFSRTGALPLGKMSDRLQVRAGSITHAVDRLEADRLVQRRQHDGDGRIVLAAITQDGRRTVEMATNALNRVFCDLGVPDRDLEALVGAITALRAANGDFTA